MDSEDFVVGLLTVVALAALIGVVGIYSVLSYGYVISVLWGWFVVPVFGLPAIGLVQAYGLALVGALAFSTVPKGDDDGAYWATILLRPWIVLVIGWVLTFWV